MSGAAKLLLHEIAVGEPLRNVLTRLMEDSFELIDRAEVTPSMLTKKQIEMITEVNELYLHLLSNIADEGGAYYDNDKQD